MYFITFMNFNNQLCSYVVPAETIAEALKLAKILSSGNPVNVVEV